MGFGTFAFGLCVHKVDRPSQSPPTGLPGISGGSQVLVRILPKRQSALFPVGLLTPKWAGPFAIQAKVSANTYRLDIPGRRHWNRTYVFNASALKTFLRRASPVTTGSLDGPGDVDNDYDSRLDPEVAMEEPLS